MTAGASTPGGPPAAAVTQAAPAPPGPALWLNGGPDALRVRWLRWVVLGEAPGLALPLVPLVLGGLLAPALVVVSVAAAAVLGGITLGGVQARLLDREVLGFLRHRWVVATGLGAALAWSATAAAWVLGATAADTRPAAAVAAVVLPTCLAAMTSVAVAQWWALRGVVGRPWRWVAGSAVARAAAVAVLAAAVLPAWAAGAPAWLLVLCATAGSLVGASLAAWLSGRTLVGVLARPEAGEPAAQMLPRPAWDDLAGSTDRYRIFDPTGLDGLPEAVQRWLRHAIVPGAPLLTAAEVHEEGHVRVGGRWRPFRSTRRVSLEGGFVWAARIPRAGLPVAGYDRFTGGTADRDWRLLGRLRLRFPYGGDADTTARSAAGRHAGLVLSLLPAAALDPSLRWVDLGRDRAMASLRVGDEVQRVTLTVTPRGMLRRIVLDRWGTPPGEGYGRYRFGATFEGDGFFDGYRLPTRVVTGWHLGSDRWHEGRLARYRITGVRFS